MTQALQGFFQRLSVDATLQAACAGAVAHGDLDTIVRLGADAGFTFTAEDLKQARASQSSELSEEDLAKAAGGFASFKPSAATDTHAAGAVAKPDFFAPPPEVHGPRAR